MEDGLGWFQRWRERRRPQQGGGGDDSSACDGCDDPGCGDLSDGCDLVPDSCDGCDACSVFDGCDCNLMISLGAFLTALPFLRSAPSLRPRSAPTVPGRGGLALIRGYQRMISPHLNVRCRYQPSCSEYGAQAVRRYGLLDGSRLAAARIARCTTEVPRGTPDPLQ